MTTEDDEPTDKDEDETEETVCAVCDEVLSDDNRTTCDSCSKAVCVDCLHSTGPEALGAAKICSTCKEESIVECSSCGEEIHVEDSVECTACSCTLCEDCATTNDDDDVVCSSCEDGEENSDQSGDEGEAPARVPVTASRSGAGTFMPDWSVEGGTRKARDFTACPTCGTTQLNIRFPGVGLQLWACESCKIIFTVSMRD